MSYIYGAPILGVSRSHTTSSKVGRTPLDEQSARPEESYQLCCVVVCDLETSRIGAPYIYDISSLRVKVPFSIFCVFFFHEKLVKANSIMKPS